MARSRSRFSRGHARGILRASLESWNVRYQAAVP
jgi:hypothetical protein